MNERNLDRKVLRQMGRYFLVICMVLQSGAMLTAQDDMMAVPENQPVKNTFESILFMDNQTVMVPIKGTFEMDFQHRFGTWGNGYDDFYGIFAPSNIRFGFDYVPKDRLMVGFGLTKDNLLLDLNGKYALIRQMKEGGAPVSLTYYVNAAVDMREEESTNFKEASDRWSFFHQVMVARKFSNDFSLQLSGNLSWFNLKEAYDAEGNFLGNDKQAQFSASALARYKFSNVMAVTLAYDLPITDQEFVDPEPNLSVGFEITTSAHAFQFFFGNYHGIIPQYNHSFNQNSPSEGLFGKGSEFLIGFNLTRLWNF